MEALLLPWMAAQMQKSRIGCSKHQSDLMSIKRETPSPQYPEFKLTFYDARGMAEMSRMILVYADVWFEDHRISFEEFSRMKQDSPFAQLPILEWNGKIIYEACSIARMLAKKYCLAGCNIFEQAQVDFILDVLRDFQHSIAEYVEYLFGLKAGDDEALYNDVFVPAVAKYFPVLERVAAESQNGFLVESGVTFVDFELANTVETIKNFHPNLLTRFPCVQAVASKVFSLPQLKEYVKTRPQSSL